MLPPSMTTHIQVTGKAITIAGPFDPDMPQQHRNIIHEALLQQVPYAEFVDGPHAAGAIRVGIALDQDQTITDHTLIAACRQALATIPENLLHILPHPPARANNETFTTDDLDRAADVLVNAAVQADGQRLIVSTTVDTGDEFIILVEPKEMPTAEYARTRLHYPGEFTPPSLN